MAPTPHKVPDNGSPVLSLVPLSETDRSLVQLVGSTDGSRVSEGFAVWVATGGTGCCEAVGVGSTDGSGVITGGTGCCDTVGA